MKGSPSSSPYIHVLNNDYDAYKQAKLINFEMY